MRLLFNGQQIGETNAAQVVPARELLRNKRDVGYGFRWTLDVDARLRLIDNQADTTAQMTAVQTRLAGGTVGDLKFQYDDNADTVHAWLTANTFTGVRCTNLTWTGKPGAQFRTFRTFTARFQWEEVFVSASDFLLDFTETIRVRGGVPEFVLNKAVNDVAAEAVVTVAQPPWFATQSGTAVGLNGWPAATLFPPLWGATNPPLEDRDFTYESPETKGEAGATKRRGYPVKWSYSFKSPATLLTLPGGADARPTLWS